MAKEVTLKGKQANEWEAYLIKADELAEAGRDDEADRVRRMGGIIRDLVRRIVPPARLQPRIGNGRFSVDLDNGRSRCDVVVTAKRVFLSVYRTSPTGRFALMLVANGYSLRRDLVANPDRPDYLPTRIREFLPTLVS